MWMCVCVFIHTHTDFCANRQERPRELRASALTYHTHVLIPGRPPCDEWAGRTGSSLAKKGTLTCARRLEGPGLAGEAPGRRGWCNRTAARTSALASSTHPESGACPTPCCLGRAIAGGALSPELLASPSLPGCWCTVVSSGVGREMAGGGQVRGRTRAPPAIRRRLSEGTARSAGV